MRNRFDRLLISCGIASATLIGCGTDSVDPHGNALGAEEAAAGAGGWQAGAVTGDGDLVPADLDCPRGPTGEIRVEFACDDFTVVTCKDLSNVVIEFEDGERQRFEGLKGRWGSFAGTGEHEGKAITRVWIKAGANHSGDGPGYGTRFEADEDSCEPPEDETPPTDECGDVPDEDCDDLTPPVDEPPTDECGDVPDEDCGDSTPPVDEPPTDECGDVPDEDCGDSTPPEDPPETCADPTDPDCILI